MASSLYPIILICLGIGSCTSEKQEGSEKKAVSIKLGGGIVDVDGTMWPFDELRKAHEVLHARDGKLILHSTNGIIFKGNFKTLLAFQEDGTITSVDIVLTTRAGKNASIATLENVLGGLKLRNKDEVSARFKKWAKSTDFHIFRTRAQLEKGGEIADCEVAPNVLDPNREQWSASVNFVVPKRTSEPK